MSAKTSGSVPSPWPSFLLSPAEEAPEVTAHQIESLGGKVPFGAKTPAAHPTTAPNTAARAAAAARA